MEGSKKERVAVYIRIANENQDVLAHHIKTMKQYVDDHPDWELATIHADIANSAQLAKRTGLADLIRGARNGEYKVIVVPKPSMLARGSMAHYKLLTKLEQAGATVTYADGTPAKEAKLLMQIMKALGSE